MHKEILSEKQIDLLPKLQVFKDEFGLVGGTAIALHLGHRRSIDFDLATKKKIKASAIRKKVLEFGKIDTVLVDNEDEYTFVLKSIKFTFFNYPFPVKLTESLEDMVFLPDLETLAAMKAYALGRRAKWKDYVDLYFAAKELGSLNPIIRKAEEIFKMEFNEKNFRAQLSYFEDIDHSEKIIFQEGFKVNDNEIKKKLLEYSV